MLPLRARTGYGLARPSVSEWVDMWRIEDLLNSVSAFQGTLVSSKSRVYLLMDRDPVGQSASRSVGFSKWTVLIGRTGFDAISSVPDPTLSLTQKLYRNGCIVGSNSNSNPSL